MGEFSSYSLDDKAHQAWQGQDFEGTNGNIPSTWEPCGFSVSYYFSHTI